MFTLNRISVLLHSIADAAEGLVLGITGADAVAAATPADSGASAQASFPGFRAYGVGFRV